MNSSNPIFIVGSSRSGTTLLAAMLNAHPNIACGPESQLLKKLKPQTLKNILNDPSWPSKAVRALSEIEIAKTPIISAFDITPKELEQCLSERPAEISSLFEAIAGVYAKKRGKPRWAEKTPRHLLYLPTIRKAFPNAQIIRIVRDPRDSALSMRKLPWSSNEYLPNLYLWCEWYEASDDFFKHDKHSTTISYEALVESPEENMRALCTFIGEEFAPSMLNTTTSADSVRTSNETWKQQVSGPLDIGRLYRWKTELSKEEKIISDGICEKWLKKFHYPHTERTLHAHPSFGLTSQSLENNSAFLQKSALGGEIFVPYCKNRELPGFFFVSDKEISNPARYFSLARKILASRSVKKQITIKYDASSKYRLRKNLLRFLAMEMH